MNPLLTDLYELTMACAYWRSGTAEKEAVFHHFFRQAPFGGGFTIACGLASTIEYLRGFHFEASDLSYLASIPGNDQRPLFDPAFLEYLGQIRLQSDVDAVPEGTVVFPQEPLLRVQGPILQAQILESALLNFLNFQSLIATKAARICLAAQGQPVVEFGLRRAQGMDGALTASYSAYVGGCSATSNVLAGKRYGIPVAGTLAHSWVMAFDSELEAFAEYSKALPNNCIFLVDTYDSRVGIQHAIEIGRQLRAQGHRLGGIRLDSGDLAFLSIEARKALVEAGFADAVIVGSNELDERIIESLKLQGATINVWGVGTRLVTAYDQPALGGVYKLSALRAPGGAWQNKIKLSEQAAKITSPGIQQVRRFRSVADRGSRAGVSPADSPRPAAEFIGDAIYDLNSPLPKAFTIVDPLDPTRRKHFDPETPAMDLLVPIFRAGQLVYEPPALPQVRAYARQQLAMLHPGIKRRVNPHQYPAGLELGLHELRMGLILERRDEVSNPNRPITSE